MYIISYLTPALDKNDENNVYMVNTQLFSHKANLNKWNNHLLIYIYFSV